MSKRQSSLIQFVSKRSKTTDNCKFDIKKNNKKTIIIFNIAVPTVTAGTSSVQPAESQLHTIPGPSHQSHATPGPGQSHSPGHSLGAPSDIAQHKSESPVQPTGVSFPTSVSSKRSFQVSWYSDFPWIEYSVETDAAFCFPCRFFGCASDNALTHHGFRDWKHARGKSGTLTYHDSCCSKHHQAVLSWKEYKATVANTNSVAVQLEHGRLKSIQDNRVYVKVLLESILYCCQQGLPLRGHREVIDTEDTSVNIGNFRSLVVLQSRNNEIVRQKLTAGPKNATWLGNAIQNSLISLLADTIRSLITDEVHAARYFTLIADETKDVSKVEQLSVVLRYVYKSKTYERFISYSKCDELNAEALFTYIIKALTEMDVDIGNCISQCYDGASVMSGCNTGVRTRITDVNPAAVYIHCHAHQLNLVLVDSCKKLTHAFEFFSLLETLYVFMSSSIPHAIFMNQQRTLNFPRVVQLKQLSDTRWSCRYSSIKAVLQTVSAVIRTLEQISDDSNDRSIEARGLLHQVKDFPFLLSIVLFEKVFSIANNLSNLLQADNISYACVASCIKATKSALSDLRSEDVWAKVWSEATTLAESCDVTVTSPRSRRTRRIPRHLDNSLVDSTIVTARETLVDDYRTQVYYATIDVLLEEMGSRFSELNLSLLKALEALLPTSPQFLDISTLRPFLVHYSISDTAIEAEASLVKVFLADRGHDPHCPSLHEVYSHLVTVPECFPQLVRCYQIALTMGISSATAERSFSSLRRIKTYLRSTMTQDRLSNLALINIERDLSSQLWNRLDELVIRFAESHRNSRIVLM